MRKGLSGTCAWAQDPDECRRGPAASPNAQLAGSPSLFARIRTGQFVWDTEEVRLLNMGSRLITFWPPPNGMQLPPSTCVGKTIRQADNHLRFTGDSLFRYSLNISIWNTWQSPEVHRPALLGNLTEAITDVEKASGGREKGENHDRSRNGWVEEGSEGMRSREKKKRNSQHCSTCFSGPFPHLHYRF